MNPLASRITAQGGDLRFLGAGSGPAVIVMHGIGGHEAEWRPLMVALSADHTVYATTPFMQST